MNRMITILLIYSVYPTKCQSYIFSKFSHPHEMAQTPFTLYNGEYYRDMYTIGNSVLVGNMAITHQYNMDQVARVNNNNNNNDID